MFRLNWTQAFGPLRNLTNSFRHKTKPYFFLISLRHVFQCGYQVYSERKNLLSFLRFTHFLSRYYSCWVYAKYFPVHNFFFTVMRALWSLIMLSDHPTFCEFAPTNIWNGHAQQTRKWKGNFPSIQNTPSIFLSFNSTWETSREPANILKASKSTKRNKHIQTRPLIKSYNLPTKTAAAYEGATETKTNKDQGSRRRLRNRWRRQRRNED